MTFATTRSPGSNTDEGRPRDNIRPRPAARRSRPTPARRYDHRRPAWGGGHRPLSPLRDPGDRHTDRAVRPILAVDRRDALSADGWRPRTSTTPASPHQTLGVQLTIDSDPKTTHRHLIDTLAQ